MGCGENIVVPVKHATKYTNTIFRVLVGDSQVDGALKEFHLHAFYLSQRSRFFRAALNRDWKEAVERTVKLPKEDAELIELYISLIFFGTVPIGDKIDKNVKDGDKVGLAKAINARYRKLLELFLLCDRLSDRGAKNNIIDAVVEQFLAFYLISSPDDDPSSD